MVARVVTQLPEGNDWIYEVKFDGYRALLLKGAQGVQIRSRNDNDLTRQYPAVTDAASRLHATTAIVDGEVVAIDATGHPSFQALQHRGSHPGNQVVFYAFDLLHLNGVERSAASASRASSRSGRRRATTPARCSSATTRTARCASPARCARASRRACAARCSHSCSGTTPCGARSSICQTPRLAVGAAASPPSR
jgi:hypothetical protein